MATGDHPTTALAIAKQIGLVPKNDSHKVWTSNDIDSMTDQRLGQLLKTSRVFARMTPSAKLRIASILQRKGFTVAVTGDGVNDAPALKQADIGIAMGKNGTDVAREAADIVLSDDNYATIINAIEEGRTQLRNIRRTSFFLASCSVAQVLTLIVFLLFDLPIPLLAKQILWLNLVTSGVTDIALATEPVHEDVLNAKPTSAKEGIINRKILPFMIITNIVMISLSLLVFVNLKTDTVLARTGVFYVLSITQIFNLYNLRSLKKSIFTIGIFSNRNVTIASGVSFLLMLAVIYLPGLNSVFEFSPLPWSKLIVMTLLSASIIVSVELYKKLQFSGLSEPRAA